MSKLLYMRRGGERERDDPGTTTDLWQKSAEVVLLNTAVYGAV